MSELAISSLFDVAGKVALVTGGGTGLGYMMASALAENGAKVYIVGRRQEKLNEAVAWFAASKRGTGKLVALQGDVSDKSSITTLVERFGKIELVLDILINAAGILRPDPVRCHPDDTEHLVASLYSADWVDWQQTMDLNVSSLYFTSVGFAPLLQAAALAKPSTAVVPRESPCVVNIGSLAGLHNSRTAGPVSYQVSKAAVIHLTKVLATRFLPLHVRVNALAPGLFPSEMTNTDPVALRESHKEHFKAMPEGRAGSPADIAGPALFLASRAGAYINGMTLDVGGGRSLVLSGVVVP